MKCDQVRDMLLDRLDGDGEPQPMPDLDVHLQECTACQTWYKEQQVAAAALAKLERIDVPDDFSARVLARLHKRDLIRPHPRSKQWRGLPHTLRRIWSDLVANMKNPIGRRRLAPALVTAAAALVVAVSLFAIAQGTAIPVTPGAATGSPAWPIFAGAIMVVALAVLGLLFLRRK